MCVCVGVPVFMFMETDINDEFLLLIFTLFLKEVFLWTWSSTIDLINWTLRSWDISATSQSWDYRCHHGQCSHIWSVSCLIFCQLDISQTILSRGILIESMLPSYWPVRETIIHFLDSNSWHERNHPTVGNVTPELLALGCLRKQVEHASGKM